VHEEGAGVRENREGGDSSRVHGGRDAKLAPVAVFEKVLVKVRTKDEKTQPRGCEYIPDYFRRNC